MGLQVKIDVLGNMGLVPYASSFRHAPFRTLRTFEKRPFFVSSVGFGVSQGFIFPSSWASLLLALSYTLPCTTYFTQLGCATVRFRSLLETVAGLAS